MELGDKQYGPCWKLVNEYIYNIPSAFAFDKLGQTDARDSMVQRLHDWQTAARVMGYQVINDKDGSYDLDPGDAEDTNLLNFLTMLDCIDNKNNIIAKNNNLQEQINNAVNDALDMLHEAYPAEEDYFEFIGAIPESRVGEWELSIKAQCANIATEIVVAHLTPIRLFRDMWYWYKRGHWPCGWDGNWPKGKLIVF